MAVAGGEQAKVLLIEDDDGDAVLVEELLREAGSEIVVQRARLLSEARKYLPDADCVLLDLGLPDSQGLPGLQELLRQEPDTAVVVLTGDTDEYLGEEAVRAGAQDYLVKGDVSGKMLNRVIRYAVERRRWDEAQRQLHAAMVSARENDRLERGLLPTPILEDPRLTVATQYRAGGAQRLLGGDFYDLVQAADGWVHALVGDVCGHGPAEAALGVSLRAAWRALVLAGQAPAAALSAVQLVLRHEQQEEAMFATVCMLSVAPGRRRGILRLAGHPLPLLVTPDQISELNGPACPPVGLNDTGEWPGLEVELGERWALLMYTDGLIEGRINRGPDRLGSEGLMALMTNALGTAPFDPRQVSGEALLARLIGEVRDLNRGDLNDDIAILGLGYA